jgi:hypothetical protein
VANFRGESQTHITLPNSNSDSSLCPPSDLGHLDRALLRFNGVRALATYHYRWVAGIISSCTNICSDDCSADFSDRLVSIHYSFLAPVCDDEGITGSTGLISRIILKKSFVDLTSFTSNPIIPCPLRQDFGSLNTVKLSLASSPLMPRRANPPHPRRISKVSFPPKRQKARQP